MQQYCLYYPNCLESMRIWQSFQWNQGFTLGCNSDLEEKVALPLISTGTSSAHPASQRKHWLDYNKTQQYPVTKEYLQFQASFMSLCTTQALAVIVLREHERFANKDFCLYKDFRAPLLTFTAGFCCLRYSFNESRNYHEILQFQELYQN